MSISLQNHENRIVTLENSSANMIFGTGFRYKPFESVFQKNVDQWNTTGYPMFLCGGDLGSSGNKNIIIWVDDIYMGSNNMAGDADISISCLIPAGSKFRVSYRDGVFYMLLKL